MNPVKSQYKYSEENPRVVLFSSQYGGETSVLQPFIYIDFVRHEPPISCKDDGGLFLDLAYNYNYLCN